MFGLCCLSRCWTPCVVYRCWSHHFIVSFPFSNSVMALFSNHLSLKDFILLVLSSSLLFRIFTYSILILLFISTIHLPFILEGWISFCFHFCISIGARLFLIQLVYIFLLPVCYIFHL